MFDCWLKLAVPLGAVGLTCAVLSDAPFGIIPVLVFGGAIWAAFKTAQGLSGH